MDHTSPVARVHRLAQLAGAEGGHAEGEASPRAEEREDLPAPGYRHDEERCGAQGLVPRQRPLPARERDLLVHVGDADEAVVVRQRAQCVQLHGEVAPPLGAGEAAVQPHGFEREELVGLHVARAVHLALCARAQPPEQLEGAHDSGLRPGHLARWSRHEVARVVDPLGGHLAHGHAAAQAPRAEWEHVRPVPTGALRHFTGPIPVLLAIVVARITALITARAARRGLSLPRGVPLASTCAGHWLNHLCRTRLRAAPVLLASSHGQARLRAVVGKEECVRGPAGVVGGSDGDLGRVHEPRLELGKHAPHVRWQWAPALSLSRAVRCLAHAAQPLEESLGHVLARGSRHGGVQAGRRGGRSGGGHERRVEAHTDLGQGMCERAGGEPRGDARDRGVGHCVCGLSREVADPHCGVVAGGSSGRRGGGGGGRHHRGRARARLARRRGSSSGWVRVLVAGGDRGSRVGVLLVLAALARGGRRLRPPPSHRRRPLELRVGEPDAAVHLAGKGGCVEDDARVASTLRQGQRGAHHAGDVARRRRRERHGAAGWGGGQQVLDGMHLLGGDRCAQREVEVAGRGDDHGRETVRVVQKAVVLGGRVAEGRDSGKEVGAGLREREGEALEADHHVRAAA